MVEEELRRRNQTWNHFLFYRADQPAPIPQAPQLDSQPAKRRTKRKAQKRKEKKTFIIRPKVRKRNFL